MAKCRGCGKDTRDYEADVGWMHFECEIQRHRDLHAECVSMSEADHQENIAMRRCLEALGEDVAHFIERGELPQSAHLHGWRESIDEALCRYVQKVPGDVEGAS